MQQLIDRLHIAQKNVGLTYLPLSFESTLEKIRHKDDLLLEADNYDSSIWWFVSPIAFELFGADGLNLSGSENIETIAVISPMFLDETDKIIAEICKLGCSVNLRSTIYSQTLAGLLYGGYPWFEAFNRAANDLSIYDQKTNVLDISIINKSFNIVLLNKNKNKIRTMLSKPKIIEYYDLEYPGLIRPFHMPEPFEIERHVKATKI